MIKTLSKKRSSKELLNIYMKTVLVIIIGVLLWNNNDARMITSDALQNVSDFIEPNNTNDQTIGEMIDDFLN